MLLAGTETGETYLKKTAASGLVAPEDPADTALAILKGGASRTREIYYPYLNIQPMVLLRDWCTNLLEMGNAWTFAPMVSRPE